MRLHRVKTFCLDQPIRQKLQAHRENVPADPRRNRLIRVRSEQREFRRRPAAPLLRPTMQPDDVTSKELLSVLDAELSRLPDTSVVKKSFVAGFVDIEQIVWACGHRQETDCGGAFRRY